MESELTTTPLTRGFVATRDHSAPRRAYLDTYAKRRSTTIEKMVVRSSSAPQTLNPSIPNQNEYPLKPTVVAVPIKTNIPAVAPVDNFSYSSSKSKIIPSVSVRKSYLDTLVQRHMNAVAEAPASLETIFESTLTQTEMLFEDPEKVAQLEANLRALYSDSLTDMISKDTKSASAAHMRTIVASAFMCGFMAVGIFTFMGKYDYQAVTAQPIGSPVIEVEASASTPINAPAAVNEVAPIINEASQPIRMVISSLGVNAPVEALGTTAEGLIAVPKAYGVVGWYNKSSVPGKAGPSVLVGHNTGNNNGVFDNLKNLKNGDLITTTNSKGQSVTYRVNAMKEYEKDKVPMAELFKSSKESRLEIITCSGKWRANNYTNRLVVTAELVR